MTDRLAGARVAAENAGAQVDLEIIATAALTVEGASPPARARRRPRRERPDAVFAANDLVALGVLQSLILDGRMLVPDDIALIGFDDIDFAAAAVVPLSSIRQPSRMIGRPPCRSCSKRRRTRSIPRQTVFQPELVVRASTRRR